MANAYENTSLVTKIIMKHFVNNLVLIERTDKQLDTQNIYQGTSKGGKTGPTVYVRRPVEFVASDGSTLVIQDIEEAKVPVTANIRKHVGFQVTSEDKTLRIDELEKRYLMPSAKRLAQKYESELASLYYQISNYVGTPGTTPSTFSDITAADTVLNNWGVPVGDRYAFWNSKAKNALANGIKAVFVQKMAKRALEKASFGEYGGFDMNYLCQSLANHTVGVLGGTPLVDGASQNVTYAASKEAYTQELDLKGWTGSVTNVIRRGDVFTIAGVNSVNMETKEDSGELATFTVFDSEDSTAGGLTTVTISPPIITSGPYQTVTAAPADNAAITIKTGASNAVHPQNLFWHEDAFTTAMLQLDVPDEGAKAYRQNFKNMSLRTVMQYDIDDDITKFRVDFLAAIKLQNPLFAGRVTG